MEVNNGIIIDGVLHVLKETKCDYCLKCSLRNKCDDGDYLICDMFGAGRYDCFFNYGKVTDIKIDKEE